MARRVDKKLLAQVAYLYHVKGMTQARIGKRIQKHQGTVNRLLRDAKLLGIVHSVIDADAAVRGTEDGQLADDLRDAFNPGLKDALVVDVGEFSGSDDVHIALANATGARVPIESNDHLAVAGGRAIVRLAHVISRNPPSCRDITITPLGGRLWAGQLWAVGSDAPSHLEQPLNPDYSALVLAVGLHAGHQPGIKFSQISHPLYAHSVSQAHQVIKANCAFLPSGGWNWGLKPPSKAFVGTGVVKPGSGHRIAEYLERKQGAATSTEDDPYEIIRQAVELVNSTELPYFGDVANRLFCALPIVADDTVPRTSIAKNIDTAKLDEYTVNYELLLKKLEYVNSRAVVMQWSHLQDICSGGRVYVIAGGLNTKLNVLWTLALAGVIHPECRLVTGISTDSDTAAALVAANRAYANAAPHVRDWFEKMLPMIFSSDCSSHKLRP